MLPKKISKHTTILTRRLRERATRQEMAATGDPTLRTIARCLDLAHRDDFTAAQREAFERVEDYRRELLSNHELINYPVFNLPETATVSSECKRATSPPIWARFLFLLATELGAERILEMGTNLGISGSYLLEAIRDRPEATLTTMDGVPKYAEMAGKQFAGIVEPDRFEILLGNYDDTFPELVGRAPDFDLLFIDGNHREGPTVDYFEELLPHARRPSVWVFDDINWTPGMVRAWEKIRSAPEATYSIDLYKLGIVVVNGGSGESSGGRYGLHLSY